jgi:hypothetical protein
MRYLHGVAEALEGPCARTAGTFGVNFEVAGSFPWLWEERPKKKGFAKYFRK